MIIFQNYFAFWFVINASQRQENLSIAIWTRRLCANTFVYDTLQFRYGFVQCFHFHVNFFMVFCLWSKLCCWKPMFLTEDSNPLISMHVGLQDSESDVCLHATLNLISLIFQESFLINSVDFNKKLKFSQPLRGIVLGCLNQSLFPPPWIHLFFILILFIEIFS